MNPPLLFSSGWVMNPPFQGTHRGVSLFLRGDDHDFNFKLNHALKFLKEGAKVKVDVFFKGRSIIYKEQGELILLKFAQAIVEYGKIEQMPKLEGKRMIMIISPKK